MVPLKRLPDWPAVGARVAQARHALGLTQAELGARMDLDRTVIAKIENGNRMLSALELADLARSTDLPVEWFVTESLPVVASHRGDDFRETSIADLRVDVLAREVTQLLEFGLLRPVVKPIALSMPQNLEGAERAADEVRRILGCEADNRIDLSVAAADMNLFTYSLPLPDSKTDGAYVAIKKGLGVALINGISPSARRRFTLAHEIGHHVFQDEYAIDLDLSSSTSTERLIDAFAIHLLLPRETLKRRWSELHGHDEYRRAAIIIGAEYRISWTALCGQLVNVGLIDRSVGEVLREITPSKGEYLEHDVSIVEELVAPWIHRPVEQAVLRGYRKHLLGAGRVIELLHGTLSEDDLPDQNEIPRAALAGELREQW